MDNLDYQMCDYDDLDIAGRMRACEAARWAAIDGPPPSRSAWCALDAGDPRRIAYENEYAKQHAK